VRVNRTVLHFSHANGFPAPAYRALFEGLEARFQIEHIEALGMDPEHPPGEGWKLLVAQLIARFEHYPRPVLAVGHSLGGYLSYLAAVRRPELVRALILLDAPIIGPIKGRLLGATKRIGIVDRVTPAGAMRERRSAWSSFAEAERHFRTRRLFRDFAPECLRDYVRYGLAERDGQFHLKIDPAIEYRIYRGIPHGMYRYLKHLRVPAGFIGGADSDVVRRTGLAPMRGSFQFMKLPGGHLFPFEHPREAARAIIEMARRLGVA
jgi:pimeloyl-ACP methyl ester carboxylesterase